MFYIKYIPLPHTYAITKTIINCRDYFLSLWWGFQNKKKTKISKTWKDFHYEIIEKGRESNKFLLRNETDEKCFVEIGKKQNGKNKNNSKKHKYKSLIHSTTARKIKRELKSRHNNCKSLRQQRHWSNGENSKKGKKTLQLQFSLLVCRKKMLIMLFADFLYVLLFLCFLYVRKGSTWCVSTIFNYKKAPPPLHIFVQFYFSFNFHCFSFEK